MWSCMFRSYISYLNNATKDAWGAKMRETGRDRKKTENKNEIDFCISLPSQLLLLFHSEHGLDHQINDKIQLNG